MTTKKENKMTNERQIERNEQSYIPATLEKLGKLATALENGARVALSPFEREDSFLDAARFRRARGDKFLAWRDFILADKYGQTAGQRKAREMQGSQCASLIGDLRELNQSLQVYKQEHIKELETAMPQDKLYLALNKFLFRTFGVHAMLPAEGSWQHRFLYGGQRR